MIEISDAGVLSATALGENNETIDCTGFESIIASSFIIDADIAVVITINANGTVTVALAD